MGNKHRITLEKVYHHRYRRVSNLDYSVCFYCGCASGAEDHVPPLATVDRFGTDALAEVDFVLVPACHTCNSMLSDKPIMSIKNRAAVLLGRYLETHANIVLLPDWGSEVDELTGHLREYVENTRSQKAVLEIRIQNLERIDQRLALMEPPMPEQVAVPQQAKRKGKSTSPERKAAIAHADACRKHHLQSLIGKSVKQDKPIEELPLEEYEAALNAQAMERLDRGDGSGTLYDTPPVKYKKSR